MSSHDGVPVLKSFEEASTAMDFDGGEINPTSQYVQLSSSPPSNKSEDKSARRTWNSWTGRVLHGPQSQTRSTQRVTLYSHRENGLAEIEVLDVPSRRSSNADAEDGVSGGIIEGNLTSSFLDSSGDYDNLNGLGSFGWDEPSTTIALELCKKYVIKPYHIFLKVIGWRSFRSRYDPIPWYKKICNIGYPSFIFLMLLFACASQITTCFSRSRSRPPETRGNYSILFCDDHIVTRDIISYLLILGAYLGGLFIFRYFETEHLSSLSETVFLSYNYTTVNKSRKKPVFVLLSFLVSGILWFILSFATSILRIFTLGLNKSSTIIHWFIRNTTADIQDSNLKVSLGSYKAIHYTFVSSSMLGFIFFDLLYIAVVINYASQCQLLIFYMENIRDKVLNKQYKTLTSALKEIYHVYEFLKVLNGKLAFVTTLITFVFVANVISSYTDLSELHSGHKKSIVLGFFNMFQWIVAFVFPVVMATILTAKGKSLRVLGLQVACRPYVYSDTPDLELEMFLNYTRSTRYAAKISFVPMYPSLVFGSLFLLFLFITLNIWVPPVTSVSWF